MKSKVGIPCDEPWEDVDLSQGWLRVTHSCNCHLEHVTSFSAYAQLFVSIRKMSALAVFVDPDVTSPSLSEYFVQDHGLVRTTHDNIINKSDGTPQPIAGEHVSRPLHNE
jgi:hypothetical protein